MDNLAFDPGLTVFFLLIVYCALLVQTTLNLFLIHSFSKAVSPLISGWLFKQPKPISSSREFFLGYEVSWLVVSPIITWLVFSFVSSHLFPFAIPNHFHGLSFMYLFLISATLWLYDKNVEYFKLKGFKKIFLYGMAYTFLGLMLDAMAFTYLRQSAQALFNLFYLAVQPLTFVLLTIIFIRLNHRHQIQWF